MNSKADIQKSFYIHTLGCKVNQYESQAMREILISGGFNESASKESAGIYIVNTCTVTHHADKECRYLIGMLHRTNPQASIVLAGCYVENGGKDVLSLPGVTHIVKNSEKNRIADILSERSPAQPIGRPGLNLAYPVLKVPSAEPNLAITGFKDRTKAFVKIQDGCENRCSYCKVPLVRSVLESKPLDKIVEEVSVLARAGFKEMVLAGICLGAWGKEIFPSEIAGTVGLAGADLVDVLKALEKIDGDFRIRLSSIELKYVTDELVEFMSNSKRICAHLHIPLQSGDDTILKRMNRPYTASGYLDVVSKLVRSMKDIAISTDVMVGFPGESNANFKNTMSLIKAIMPVRAHIFTFSKRDGTPAFNMVPEVPEYVARERYNDLRKDALLSSYLYRTMFLERTLRVLVETKRDNKTRLLTGYSDNYIKVLFGGPDELKGKIVPVRITEVTQTHTKGVKITWPMSETSALS